jgi:hypothetical protein
MDPRASRSDAMHPRTWRMFDQCIALFVTVCETAMLTTTFAVLR